MSRICGRSELGRLARIFRTSIHYLVFFWLARSMYETRHTSAPVSAWQWLLYTLFMRRNGVYWPVRLSSCIRDASNIVIGIETAPGLSPCCYIQGKNGIIIGDYTLVGPHVGIISSNHNIYDARKHEQEGPIIIGNYCWIGKGASILPGVRLGNHTVVAAGAVVTRSYVDGYCVLAGIPAKPIRNVAQEKVVNYRRDIEYIGYHRVQGKDRFELYEKLGLNKELRQISRTIFV